MRSELQGLWLWLWLWLWFRATFLIAHPFLVAAVEHGGDAHGRFWVDNDPGGLGGGRVCVDQGVVVVVEQLLSLLLERCDHGFCPSFSHLDACSRIEYQKWEVGGWEVGGWEVGGLD